MSTGTSRLFRKSNKMFELTKFPIEHADWHMYERSPCDFHWTSNKLGIRIIHVRINRIPPVSLELAVLPVVTSSLAASDLLLFLSKPKTTAVVLQLNPGGDCLAFLVFQFGPEHVSCDVSVELQHKTPLAHAFLTLLALQLKKSSDVPKIDCSPLTSMR